MSCLSPRGSLDCRQSTLQSPPTNNFPDLSDNFLDLSNSFPDLSKMQISILATLFGLAALYAKCSSYLLVLTCFNRGSACQCSWKDGTIPTYDTYEACQDLLNMHLDAYYDTHTQQVGLSR